MSIPFRPKLLDYQLSKLGESATLRQFVKSGVDSYGDEIYTATETTVVAIISTITNTRMPFERRGELGHYYMMQVEFFIKDDVDMPNLAVTKPPELIHRDLTYVITEVEDSGIGALRLIGYRERK